MEGTHCFDENNRCVDNLEPPLVEVSRKNFLRTHRRVCLPGT